MALAQIGNLEEAAAVIVKGIDLKPGVSLSRVSQRLPGYRAGYHAHLVASLRMAGLPD